MSNSLQPHGPQHARLPCPSTTPRVYSNSCPLSRWCHPTISSSVIPFCSHLQTFPPSRSFQMSQIFTLGGQSIGVSASASVLPMNTQDWFPLGWTGLISLQSRGTLKSLFQYHSLGHCDYLNHVTQIAAGVNQAVVPSRPVTALDLIDLSRYSC